MSVELLKWNIYEITTETTQLIGVSFRGRVRKFALLQSINLLIENTENKENCVRFAVLNVEDLKPINEYIKTIANDATINLVAKQVANPVLSKLTVNNEVKYRLDSD
jgi:hypothetical protein